MDQAPTNSTPEAAAPAPAPAKKKVAEYDGRTFCDLAGCSDDTRFFVKRTFANQSKTAADWTAALAKHGIAATVVK